MSAASHSLARLLDGLAALPRDVQVSDLTQDGRAAQPGCAFLALHGSAEHGLKYAPQAVANGARAVLWEPAPVAVVPDLPSQRYQFVSWSPASLGNTWVDQSAAHPRRSWTPARAPRPPSGRQCFPARRRRVP